MNNGGKGITEATTASSISVRFEDEDELQLLSHFQEPLFIKLIKLIQKCESSILSLKIGQRWKEASSTSVLRR